MKDIIFFLGIWAITIFLIWAGTTIAENYLRNKKKQNKK